VCVLHTHTHTPRGVLGCESRGRDETHIHTHTAHGVLDVSPGVGTRNLGGTEEHRWTLACVNPIMYTSYPCIYVCWEAA